MRCKRNIIYLVSWVLGRTDPFNSLAVTDQPTHNMEIHLLITYSEGVQDLVLAGKKPVVISGQSKELVFEYAEKRKGAK